MQPAPPRIAITPADSNQTSTIHHGDPCGIEPDSCDPCTIALPTSTEPTPIAKSSNHSAYSYFSTVPGEIPTPSATKPTNIPGAPELKPQENGIIPPQLPQRPNVALQIPADTTDLSVAPQTPISNAGKRAKSKAKARKACVKTRRLVLRKSVLSILVGRQLAGPIRDLIRMGDGAGAAVGELTGGARERAANAPVAGGVAAGIPA